MITFEKFDFSNLDTDFYKFDRARLLKINSLEKRLSSNSINYKYIIDDTDFLKKAITYLTKFYHGIFTLVTKEVNVKVNLTFKTNSSYCDLSSNNIVINLESLINKQLPYQFRVDIILGLIFHEFLHKRVTNSDIATYLTIDKKDYYNESNKGLITRFLTKTINSNVKKHILNILEDFRIEKLGVRDFPGFGFFLDELRKYAFYHLSIKEYDKDELVLFLLEYLMMVVLMPELKEITKNKAIDYLSGIDNDKKSKYLSFVSDIEEYFNNNSVDAYSDSFPAILRATDDLEKIFFKYISKKQDKDLKDYNTFNKGEGYLFSNNFDLPQISDELNELTEDLIINVLKQLDKDSKATNQCITEKIKKFNTEDTSVDIKIITQQPETINSEILKKAKLNAQSICSNLGFLSARFNDIDVEYELNEGEIDEDELYSIAYNKNIFCDENEIEGYELDFGILLDESGSMSMNIVEAKIACLTIMLSLVNIEHINLYVYGHTADYRINNEEVNSSIVLFKYFNTKEKLIDINTIFGADSRSSNADGYAIEKVCEIMSKSSSNKKKVLVVISDGQPSAYCYAGGIGIKHTKEIVDKYEAKGFEIIQIAMDRIENSSEMFTKYIPYETNKNFINELKKILTTKLNQFHNLK